MIEDAMGSNFCCGVLMGANVASEVAEGQMCESTLASNFGNDMDESTRLVFDSPPYFRVQHITDVGGAEACGALKNIVALGAGFLDGLELGENTKAALIRVGLQEMVHFCYMFFEGVDNGTFMQSCGIADLLTTCYGGRNRKGAEVFARKRNEDEEVDADRCVNLWKDIEAELLNGQKLQGILTLEHVFSLLESRNSLKNFRLFKTIYEIALQGKPVDRVVEGIVAIEKQYFQK